MSIKAQEEICWRCNERFKVGESHICKSRYPEEINRLQNMYNEANKLKKKYCTDRAKLKRKLETAIEALEICHKELDEYYNNMTQESRKQSVYEDEHNLWFARDIANSALNKIKE